MIIVEKQRDLYQLSMELDHLKNIIWIIRNQKMLFIK